MGTGHLKRYDLIDRSNTQKFKIDLFFSGILLTSSKFGQRQFVMEN